MPLSQGFKFRIDVLKHVYHPIIASTGFLGSGKTTLLNKLLRAENMRGTAVLVNELGR